MRVKTTFCVFVVVAGLMLTGCGSNGTSQNPSNPTPSVTLSSITITPSITSLNVGATQQLTATGKYSDGSSKNVTASVTWTSSSTSLATVSSGGLVTAVKNGNVNINATLNSISSSLKLTISAGVQATPALSAITITPGITSLGIGTTQQLTATGKYTDGSSKDLTSSVQWTSSSTGSATVSNGGLVTGVKSGSITITASESKISGTLKFSIVPVLESIMVSPMGPGIVVGSKQPFTATGSFNDGSTQDITASTTWSSSNNNMASVAAGQATGVAVGTVTVTAAMNGVSGTAALNVVNKVYAKFAGPYAFSMVTADSRGPAFFNGSVIADASGNITGVEDSNTASGVDSDVAITGTYTIYPDGRGTMVFNANACHPNGITLRFVLASGGTTGGLIEFDGKGVMKGSLTQQNSSSFSAASMNGTYVFRAIGIDSGTVAPNTSGNPQPLAEVGIFTTDGNGNLTTGNEDVNDFGSFTPFIQLNAATYSVDSTTGRGTLQMITSSGTSNFAFYMVDANHLNLIEIDGGASATALAGVAELQTAQTYSAANLSGSYSFLLDRPAVTVSGSNFTFADYEQIGFYSFDGSGNVVGTRDWESINGTAAVTANGHGTMATNLAGASGGNQDNRSYAFYMVSPSRIYLIQTGTQPTIAAVTPEAGEADLQIGAPYSEATLKGPYVLESYDLSADSTVIMLIEYNGVGGIVGIADAAQVGLVKSAEIGPAQFNIQPKGSGFIQVTISYGSSNVMTYDFFLTSNQQAWAGGANPPLDGSLQLQ